MAEEVFPIDIKGLDKVITKDAWYNTGIVAFLASFPAAVYSAVWTIMWIVQDGHGTGTSVQLNWNADPHLFMLYGFVALCWTFLPLFEKRIQKIQLKDSTNSYRITGLYNSLTPMNKQLAEPVVLKVYELERSGIWNDDVRSAYTKRIKAVEKIKAQQARDIESALVIDNSDLDAVEYVLEHRKEITSV